MHLVALITEETADDREQVNEIAGQDYSLFLLFPGPSVSCGV